MKDLKNHTHTNESRQNPCEKCVLGEAKHEPTC